MPGNSLVSIIVPVYKVEPYLRDCIDSIINQTYKNLEIILVDDGSPDNCGQICEDYAKNDSRIAVYHKENGGLSDARNYGIDRANGDFMTFVDSDDVIRPNFIEALAGLIIKYDADISVTPLFRFSNSSDLGKGEQNCDGYCTSPHDMLLEALYQHGIDHGSCGKLYTRENFAGIRFPVGLYYEDAVTTYKAIFRSRRIAITREALYAYRMRPYSIMKERFSPKILQVVPAMQEYYSAVAGKFPDLRQAASSRVFSLTRSVYLNMPFTKRSERLKVWAEMRNHRMAVITDSHARKRERIAALLSYMGADLYHLLLSRIYRIQQL